MDAGIPAAGRQRCGRMRGGVRIDMTPLVDVAFLLLTFFIISTSLSRPHALEMMMPPHIVCPPFVAESAALRLYLRADGGLFYRAGADPLRPLSLRDLKGMAVERTVADGNDLKTVLCVSADATYQQMIDVLDELERGEIELTEIFRERGIERARRFTITPMTTNDEEEVGRL